MECVGPAVTCVVVADAAEADTAAFKTHQGFSLSVVCSVPLLVRTSATFCGAALQLEDDGASFQSERSSWLSNALYDRKKH